MAGGLQGGLAMIYIGTGFLAFQHQANTCDLEDPLAIRNSPERKWN